MARLIDEDDFLKRLNERPVDYIDPGCDFYYLEETVESVLTETPTVDAVPVVHGHWVSLTDCSNAGVYCSVCRKKVYKEDYAWANRKNKLRSKFCPNCGALMDLEEEKL